MTGDKYKMQKLPQSWFLAVVVTPQVMFNAVRWCVDVIDKNDAYVVSVVIDGQHVLLLCDVINDTDYLLLLPRSMRWYIWVVSCMGRTYA